MTLEELQKNWRDYAIVFDDDDDCVDESETRIRSMQNLFKFCFGIWNEALIFDGGKDEDSCSAILKPDTEGNCYVLENEGWKKIGRFLKMCPK